ncbi:MAG: hypothetical protein ACREQ7_02420 [Candidatus Binatia bacterium]
MHIKQSIAVLFAIALSAWPIFADVKTAGTILKVNKAENQLVVRTERGEETLLFDSNSKGLANAKEGAKVTIKFTEKSGQPKVTEIIPH